MHRIRTTTAALATTAALVLAVPAAAQAGPEKDPCDKREAQVTKAEDALARVTAVFAKQQERVADAREDVAGADNQSEKAQARADLRAAKEKRAEVTKVKKAQQMRLTKAQERLAQCTAEEATAS